MKRELKFRAFIHPHCGGNIPQECYNTMDYSDNYNGDLEEFFSLYKPHFFEIMQYTGLKDKQGKDIYEGDILEDGLGEKMTIIYENKYAHFILIDEDMGYSFEDGDNMRLKVIGNIHETK